MTFANLLALLLICCLFKQSLMMIYDAFKGIRKSKLCSAFKTQQLTICCSCLKLSTSGSCSNTFLWHDMFSPSVRLRFRCGVGRGWWSSCSPTQSAASSPPCCSMLSITNRSDISRAACSYVCVISWWFDIIHMILVFSRRAGPWTRWQRGQSRHRETRTESRSHREGRSTMRRKRRKRDLGLILSTPKISLKFNLLHSVFFFFLYFYMWSF